MSLALTSRSIPSRLFRNFTSLSPVASRTLIARQKSWHLNLSLQTCCSSTPPANPLQKHARPPAQFPPVPEQDHWYTGTPNNDADQIEKWLREDGHRVWGFVIYRSTYQSNADWDEFMRRLLADITESLGDADLLDNLALTVFDDPKKFDGATTAVVRDHFKQWAATAEQEEQGPEFDPEQIKIPGSQRYRYCIQITQEMLESVLADGNEKMPVVRIIRGDWKEYSPYEDGFRFEDEGEAIEGCTLEDVGWINVPFEDVMLVTWCYLRDYWYIEYRRPPAISCYP